MNKTAHLTYVLLAIIVLVWGALLATEYRVEGYNNDAAQYISTARSLLRGEGLKTNVLYYEEQQAFGMPAPQTVWPPGYPAAIALVASTGLSFEKSAFVAALLANALAIVLIFQLVRMGGGGSTAGLLAAGAWAALYAANRCVWDACSEPLFIALSLAAIVAFCKSVRTHGYHWPLLLLAGVFAAGAFTVRYIGIALVFALGAHVGVRMVLRRDVSWLRYGFLVALPAALAIAALFTRNYLLTGTVAGAPRLSQNSSGSEIAQHLWWGFKSVLGVYSGTATVWAAVLLLLVAAVVWIVGMVPLRAALLSSGRERLQLDTAHDKHGGSTRLAGGWDYAFVAGVYVLGTVAILVSFASDTAARILASRYLVPLAPVAIVCVALWTSQAMHSLNANGSALRRRIIACASAGVLLGFVAVQCLAWQRDHLTNMSEGYRTAVVRALSAVLPGDVHNGNTETLRDYLRRRTADGSAVLEANGQFLGMLLDRPAVGLPSDLFTSRVWTEEEVRKLVQRLNVSLICVFPTTFDPQALDNRNREFIGQLVSGKIPVWARLVLDLPDVLIFEIDPSLLGA